MSGLVVAITGSKGYVGRHIARAVADAGHDVVALGRHERFADASRFYELDGSPDPRLLRGVNIVIHCAYDMSVTKAADIARVNVLGTQRLVAAAASSGVRFCFISSMSAYAGTRQVYGRAKLASERDVLSRNGQVVRLGLVYGHEPGGMIGALAGIARLPLIPVIGASCRQFTVHVFDMASAVLRLIENPPLTQDAIGLAHPAAVAFEDIMRALAVKRGNHPVLVPIPWAPVYAAMRAAEATSFRLPIRADSVLGLVRPASHVPNFHLWARIGADIRAFDPAALPVGR
jgi:nucleoside-diphosphate-sugar epimerase